MTMLAPLFWIALYLWAAVFAVCDVVGNIRHGARMAREFSDPRYQRYANIIRTVGFVVAAMVLLGCFAGIAAQLIRLLAVYGR